MPGPKSALLPTSTKILKILDPPECVTTPTPDNFSPMHNLEIPKIPLQDGSYLLIFASEDLDGQQPGHEPLPARHLLQILDIYPLALSK